MIIFSKPGLFQDLSGCHLLCNSEPYQRFLSMFTTHNNCSLAALLSKSVRHVLSSCHEWEAKHWQEGLKFHHAGQAFFLFGSLARQGSVYFFQWARDRAGNDVASVHHRCSRDSSQTPSWLSMAECRASLIFLIFLLIFKMVGMALACCGCLLLDHWICDASYTLLALAVMNSALDRHCLWSLAFSTVLSRYPFPVVLDIQIWRRFQPLYFWQFLEDETPWQYRSNPTGFWTGHGPPHFAAEFAFASLQRLGAVPGLNLNQILSWAAPKINAGRSS